MTDRDQDREREATLDEWWSSVIKRAFEQRHSEAYIAWHDMQAATAAAAERKAPRVSDLWAYDWSIQKDGQPVIKEAVIRHVETLERELADAAERIAQLARELDEAQRDAERYRWLRIRWQKPVGIAVCRHEYGYWREVNDVDAAIDAAIEQAKEQP